MPRHVQYNWVLEQPTTTTTTTATATRMPVPCHSDALSPLSVSVAALSTTKQPIWSLYVVVGHRRSRRRASTTTTMGHALIININGYISGR